MTDEQRPRRVGRPRRDHDEGERVGLSLRVTPEIKRALDVAAESHGRSLSQECELRLEQTFREESIVSQVLVALRNADSVERQDKLDASLRDLNLMLAELRQARAAAGLDKGK